MQKKTVESDGYQAVQLGGTSLLIVVGVALDTTRSLDSFMTMRNHKGFLG